MVILQGCDLALISSDHDYLAAGQVHLLDGAPVKMNHRTEMADGVEDMAWFDATGDDFRKKRLEHEVVLITDQMNLYGALSFHPAPQLQGRRDSRKAATEDHNAGGTDLHSLPLRDD